MNIYRILLELTKMHAGASELERVLEALGSAVAASDRAIKEAEKSRIEEYIDAVVDDECDVIESVIGVAFVACQAQITSVLSYVRQLHDQAQQDGYTLSSSDGSKEGLLALGSRVVSWPAYSQVQVIDAFANYFKHHDEWNGSWSRSSLTRRAQPTVEVISAMGAQQYSSGNLRKGAKMLGLADYERLVLLSEIVSDWATAVISAYEGELHGIRLI